MAATIMSWSKCVVKIAPTGTDDAIGSPLVEIGTIKDKSTTIETADGEKRIMKATGGVTIAQESSDGDIVLKTRIIEPEFKKIASVLGVAAKVKTASLIAATTIQVEKGSGAYVGAYLSDGTKKAAITAIDTTNGTHDVLTITLGAATSIGDILYQTNAAGDLLYKTNVVSKDWSVEITPKNIGATGVRIRKASVSYKEGYSEDDGQYADFEFTVLQCADGELYTKYKKA